MKVLLSFLPFLKVASDSIFRLGLLTIAVSFMAGSLAANDESEKGALVYREHCMACHQESGKGNRALNCPPIAGLPRWYVSQQLRAFQDGIRGTEKDDQSAQSMKAVTSVLNNSDVAHLGLYVERLELQNAESVLPDFQGGEGRLLYEKECLECHGKGAVGSRRLRVPPLNIQADWYLLRQLQKFKTGTRIHFSSDPKPGLSKDEIVEVITYLTGLKNGSNDEP